MNDVKWPKPKRKVSATTGIPKYNFQRPHPGTHEARRTLELEGRALDKCEECGNTDPPINVHHIDGNPYNNDPLNLLVLCRNCHQNRHGPADSYGVVPWYTGTLTPNAGDEAVGIVPERGKKQPIKILLVVGVFRCGRCDALTRAEQSGPTFRPPMMCAHCKFGQLDLAVELSTFREVKDDMSPCEAT